MIIILLYQIFCSIIIFSHFLIKYPENIELPRTVELKICLSFVATEHFMATKQYIIIEMG